MRLNSLKGQCNMWETRWEELKNKNDEIIRMISEYNLRIADGDFLEYDLQLNVDFYINLLAAHIVDLLVEDESLYVTKQNLSMLDLYNSEIIKNVDWMVDGTSCFISKSTDKKQLLEMLFMICFGENEKKIIQEICAQDIICSKKLAKEIGSILSMITTSIIIDVKGEEAIIRQLSDLRNGGGRKNTAIEEKYVKEYSRRAPLIYNRVFKYDYLANGIGQKLILSNSGEAMLNYKLDNMHCQSAVLHIGVETTGSSGTGFYISNDGYVLTCAHVVEGAKEICANVIRGDGYPVDGFEDFGVYDIPHFGEVVYANKDLDIALLKMDDCGSNFLSIEQGRLLPEIGEEVVVFGYPLGYEMPQTNRFGPNISFYKGYVSSNQVKDGNSVTFLDIDVKSGNSGSPVISVKSGKVIGIISGIKVGGKAALNEKMPYMIPIQHFLELNKL